jgi:hypothetical protein
MQPARREEEHFTEITGDLVASRMRDFADFVMARNQRLKQFKPAFEPLVKEIARHQSSDGSFQENALDDTPDDAYRYGVWFLQETGWGQNTLHLPAALPRRTSTVSPERSGWRPY